MGQQGIFITATDTMVGKTYIGAAFLKALHDKNPDTRYWKPINTGIIEEDDTETVKKLTGLSTPFIEPAYRFPDPVSPHLASRENPISPDKILEIFQKKQPHQYWIVEGAGGLLVPLCPGFLQIDLIKRLNLPVIIVVKDQLGAINHTLLSIEACRRRNIPIAGIILNMSEKDYGNFESIEEYGGICVLGKIKKHANWERFYEDFSNTIEASLRPCGATPGKPRNKY